MTWVYSLGKILFESVDGKIQSGTMPFKSANLTKPESPFFQKLDQVIQDATVEDREKRTVSVKDFHDDLQKAINITQGKKPKDASLQCNLNLSLFVPNGSGLVLS
jgi:hypothetical protein